MASSLDIKTTVIADVKARLAAMSVSPAAITAGSKRATPVYPAISISILSMANDIDGETNITGFHRVDALIDCQTYIDDDADTSAAKLLEGAVREAFSYDDIVAQMNTISSYNTYYYCAISGAAEGFAEDRITHEPLTLQMHLRPSNEK